MNAILQMTATLAQAGRIDRDAERIDRQKREQQNLSHAAAMRRAMRSGPKTARELGEAAGVPATLAQSLLKWDLHKGRVQKVLLRDGVTVYQLNAHHDAEQRDEIRRAVALLRRWGYSVKAPEGDEKC